MERTRIVRGNINCFKQDFIPKIPQLPRPKQYANQPNLYLEQCRKISQKDLFPPQLSHFMLEGTSEQSCKNPKKSLHNFFSTRIIYKKNALLGLQESQNDFPTNHRYLILRKNLTDTHVKLQVNPLVTKSRNRKKSKNLRQQNGK